MLNHIKSLKHKQVVALLRRNGFESVGGGGKHIKFKNLSNGRQVMIPSHGGADVSKIILKDVYEAIKQ